MPESKAPRPAHRPSRRQQLMDGAVELFVIKPPELVTIADIVRHVDMTPAAFYYHFSSRTELFTELVSVSGEEWATDAETQWGETDSVEGLLDVAVRLLDTAGTRRAHATLYFVTSKGVSLAIEDTRHTFTARAATAAGAALARALPDHSAARTAVGGVGLVTVLESSLRAELSLDPAYRTLGPGRFRDQVRDLCRRIAVEGVVSESLQKT